MTIESVAFAKLQNIARVDATGTSTPMAFYNVRTSNTSGANEILEYFRAGANNLPWIGDLYAYQGDTQSLSSYCSDLDVQKKDQARGNNEWLVTARYQPIENFPFTDINGFITLDPLQAKPEYRFTMAQFQEEAATAYFRRCWYYDDVNPPGIEQHTSFSRSFPTDVIGQTTPPGNKISPVNTANDPIDPPIVKDRSDLILQVVVNLAGYDVEQSTLFQDALNDSPIQLDLTGTVYGGILQWYPYQLKVNNITADWMQMTFARKWNGVYEAPIVRNYWRHVYEIHIRRGIEFPDPLAAPVGTAYPTGWINTSVNQGFNRSAQPGDPDGAGSTIPGTTLEDGQTGKARLVDGEGLPVSEPQLLDIFGQPIKQYDSTSLRVKPNYMDYQIYEESDYTDLPLGFQAWDPTA